MHKVSVIKQGVEKFGSTFTTEEEAQTWVDRQIQKGSWGKKEQIFQVAKVVPPMELIEEKYDFMGNKLFLVKIPADYEVTIEVFVEPPKDLSREIRRILRGTDWLFLSDVPVETKARVFYKEYRQMLRDMDPQGQEVETFEKWLRRSDPALFLDGGKGEKMIKKFYSNLGD